MFTISQIHDKLGLNLDNGLFVKRSSKYGSSLKDLYNGNFENFKANFRFEKAIKEINPHSFFLFNSEPVILFFDFQKNNKENIKETLKEISKKVWNFNKTPLVIVNFRTDVIIYNGFKFNTKSNLLDILDSINNIADFTNIEKYSYWKIVTSELWHSKDSEFKNDNRVDRKLLDNIKVARDLLIEKKLSPKHSNSMIGRLIFTRYLIDRKVNLDYYGQGREFLTKEKLPELISQKENLFNFFEYLLDKFNGNILPLNGEKDETNEEHLKILFNLFSGYNIKIRQGSLFNVFDFDFIPIELISNIYETFLGEKQDNDKAFYTPPFLVEYILEQTVKPFIFNQNNPEALSCKTVDFTCGSGIFLCETLRTIIDRYVELKQPERSSIEFKNTIKKLLTDNIFGNDINKDAIEIAKFSLFITLLDYFKEPKDIEDFKFPDVSSNFFSYDVFKTDLIGNEYFDSELDNTFGKEKKIEPDFIIGNPPWGKLKNSPYIKYCENRNKKEKFQFNQSYEKNEELIKLEIGNNEFSQAFLVRLSDFSTENTVCHIIVTSKILYNLQSNKFRKYYLNKFHINEVLDISSVRHQIFLNAVGPAAIIKYQYAFGNKTKENLIQYVSLKPNPYFAIFKTILIEKYDYKEVVQSELIKNDWLWKVLVFGHILDYRFIKRLRESNLLTIDRIITKQKERKKETDLIWGSEGVQVGNKKNNAIHLLEKLFLQTDKNKTGTGKSNLQRYYIHYDNNIKWKEKQVERSRNPDIFKSPFLAIKSSLSKDFKFVASISHIDAVFTKSIYAIKSYGNTKILTNILGIISSELSTYFILQTGSSTGIEREQIFDEELYPFPIIQNEEISSKAKCLIGIKRLIAIQKHSEFPDKDKIKKFEKIFVEKEQELNELIFKLYDLSDTERDLISYAQEITIPILQAKKKKYNEIINNKKLYKPYKKVEDNELNDYINVFKEHFSVIHNGGDNGYFNVRIKKSENIISCEFYIDKEQHKDEFEEKDNNNILDLIHSLGFQKISNDLFIQKDVKTLNKNSFSVIKINQYKYWHKAIARLDVVEFMEAMVESQKNNQND